VLDKIGRFQKEVERMQRGEETYWFFPIPPKIKWQANKNLLNINE
jgi:hypothetical protein